MDQELLIQNLAAPSKLQIIALNRNALQHNNQITVAANSTAIMLEDPKMDVPFTIHLEKNARLYYYSLFEADEADDAITDTVTRDASLQIHFQLQENSYLHYLNYTHLATTRSRCTISHSIKIALLEKYAFCELYGLYHLKNNANAVTQDILVEHIAPYTSSNMLYKGILNHQTRAAFSAKVHVHSGAVKSMARQLNKNILLSKEAEVKTKPELEIYADDVKCAHGATVGALDQAALFYLCSRGIDPATAVNMLLQGFADEIIRQIKHSEIKQRLTGVL